MTELDLIPTANLIQRYGNKSRYYEYLKLLAIEPTRIGKTSFITAEQYSRVEGLHQARGQGKQAESDFLARLQTSEDVSTRFNTFQEIPGTYTAEGLTRLDTFPDVQPTAVDLRLFQTLELLAKHLAKPQNPLANLEAIEQAYQHGWQLSSNQLAPLLGLKKMPKPPVRKFGFVFERVGKEWKISKDS